MNLDETIRVLRYKLRRGENGLCTKNDHQLRDGIQSAIRYLVDYQESDANELSAARRRDTNAASLDESPRKPPEGASVVTSPGFERVRIKSADGTVRVIVNGSSVSIETAPLYINTFLTDDGVLCRSFLDPDLETVLLA